MSAYTKSKELIFIITRLAANVNYPSLKQKLESWSLKLLENLALENFKEVKRNVNVLKSLVGFGVSVYEIEPINGETVLKELEKLDAAIRQLVSLPDLPDYFETDLANSEVVENADNSLDATIRQSAILERIRGVSNCQLKDLMGEFTQVSERTLRYDLQKLFNQGLINRAGNGPSTYYVIK